MKATVFAGLIVMIAACSNGDKELVGTWQFVADQEIDNSGNVINEDRKVRGQLIYTPEGDMNVQLLWIGSREAIMNDSIMKYDGFPGAVGLGQNSWTSEQRGAIIDSYDGYFGTYTVDWDEGIVTHIEEGDLRPYRFPVERKRRFVLKGDTLVLKSLELGLRWQVIWVRKK